MEGAPLKTSRTNIAVVGVGYWAPRAWKSRARFMPQKDRAELAAEPDGRVLAPAVCFVRRITEYDKARRVGDNRSRYGRVRIIAPDARPLGARG
jgi:hypothetical protein